MTILGHPSSHTIERIANSSGFGLLGRMVKGYRSDHFHRSSALSIITMKSIRQKPIPAFPKRGFALIATLSMMILLTVIAVGFLSLSTISLRSSASSSDDAIARANARMALMIAVGDLQRLKNRMP